MASDLISKKALLKTLEDIEKKFDRKKDILVNRGYMVLVLAEPTVDAVVHGEWEDDTGHLDSMKQYKCSECGKRPILNHNWVSLLTNYCPNCGARMDGEKE
ncbi:MAG: hypothetical protein IKU44_04415 [Firmicutes bacterium]|nr:hypothetical protein [Bacillota bacterium]